MSRTGTTSFSAAVSYLLKGPVYHGGTQLILNEESHIKKWISICEHTPIKSEEDRKFVLENVRDIMTGFVACTDVPSIAYVEELMLLYPDAKVIVTVRDPDRWWESMRPVVERGKFYLLSWILAPIPTLRKFWHFHEAMDQGRFGELYFRPDEPQQPTRATYDRHIAHLKKIVPKDKLFFYDVRDGWEPLCAILGVPVPKGVEFPRLNDAKAMEDLMKANVKKGLLAWTGIGLTISAAAVVGLRWARVL